MQNEVAHQLGVVIRQVAWRDHEGQPARVVIATRTYDTTAADLWDALTNPERIARWFLPVSGELRLGGRYKFEGNAGGSITACEPPKRLAVTWEFGDQVSWVAVTLAKDRADGTRLELEHIARVDDHWNQFGPGAVGVGWDLTLMGLDRHLADNGAAVDPAQVAAWSASSDGKAFMRGAAACWGRAAVAGGDEEAAAMAAADRTARFYAPEAPA